MTRISTPVASPPSPVDDPAIEAPIEHPLPAHLPSRYMTRREAWVQLLLRTGLILLLFALWVANRDAIRERFLSLFS